MGNAEHSDFLPCLESNQEAALEESAKTSCGMSPTAVTSAHGIKESNKIYSKAQFHGKLYISRLDVKIDRPVMKG